MGEAAAEQGPTEGGSLVPRACPADRGGVLAILAVAAAAALLGGVGAAVMPLTDPDEGRYAEIAREMAAGGDWVIPTLFGIPYLEKPPLLYWLTALVFHGVGQSELAARAVPVLASAVGVLVAGLYARTSWSARAGVLTAVALALCALPLVLGRTLLVDPLFSVTLSAALFAYARAREREGVSWHALAFWAALALAVLTKGPAGLVIAAAVIAVDATLERAWSGLASRRLLAGSLLFFVATLPWFVAVEMRQSGFLSFYLWKEHLLRIAGAEHDESAFFFVPWVLIGLLPWTPLVLAFLRDGAAALGERTAAGRRARFLAVWASVVFVLFSLSRGKLVTYILPLFPPLAVMIGRGLDRAVGRGAPDRATSAAFVATAIVFAALAPALAVVWGRVDTGVAPPLLAAAVVVLAAGATLLVAWRARRCELPLAALIVTSVSLYGLLAAAAPGLSRRFGAKPLIDRLASEIGPADVYLEWGEYLPSAAFYLDRPPYFVGLRPELRYGAAQLSEVPNVAADWPDFRRRTEGRRVYVLTDTKPKREKELRFLLGKETRPLARTHTAALWLRP